MSDNELIEEVQTDEEILDTSSADSIENSDDSEQLDEFKADGEESEVADPVATKSNKRKADKSGGADAMPKLTKAGLMSDLLAKASGMNKASLQAGYDAFLGSQKSQKEDGGRPADKSAEDKPSSNKIATPGQSVKEDVAEIFSGDELPEDLQERASVVFEAAINAKAIEQNEILKEEYESKLAEEVKRIDEETSQKVEDYVDYVADTWLDENKVEIESNLKVEMAESFMSGVRQLFEEHNVEVPEGQSNVIDELEAKVKELESQLDEEVNKGVEAKKDLEESLIAQAFVEATEDLTDTQIDKLKDLVEALDYENAEDFNKKLSMLKESYFSKTAVASDDIAEDDEPVEIGEEVAEQAPLTESISAYSKAISRTVRK